MKNFIHKINQYLLKRFPTIWNTRVVWMLLLASVLHLIFFIFGYFTLSNPEILQEYYVTSIFFENGSVFLNCIISILLLVFWLIYMFKNNAFKNFYPTSSYKLFGQFICYLLIIFSCSSFFLSYSYGVKTYISSTYSDEQTNKQIEIANDVAMFFSNNISNYTIDKRRYPKPFYELYCEKTPDFIDYDKPYLEFEDKPFQFYTLITKEVPYKERYKYTSEYYENENDSTYKKYVYSIKKDTISILHFKDSVFDMQPYVATTTPSYYNASHTFFISMHDTLRNVNYDYNYRETAYSDYDYDYDTQPDFTLRNRYRSKRNYELLQRNNQKEIKQLFEDFIAYSKYFKIPHNISAEEWFRLVYHPENFEVKNFIRTEPKKPFDNITVTTTEQTRYQEYFSERITDFYYDHSALNNVFENIEDIKASNPFIETIHFYMWFSFVLTCFIFMFRVTGLKPLLFSILTVGVLTLLVSLTAALLFYVNRGGSDDDIMFFVLYFVLFLSTAILTIPIFFADYFKKIVVAICVNISITGFSLYLFLIIGIISAHQYEACQDDKLYYESYYKCNTLLNSLEFNWSFVLFFIGILFILLYSKIIKKWKALPEA